MKSEHCPDALIRKAEEEENKQVTLTFQQGLSKFDLTLPKKDMNKVVKILERNRVWYYRGN